MDSLLDTHVHNTGVAAEVCVADSKYGTIENYLSCHDRGVKSHFASLELGQRGSGRQAGIIPKESFTYEAATDCFICPASEQLSRRRFSTQRQQWEYTAPPKSCSRCALQPQCTRSKSGRSLKRHKRQAELDRMLSQAQSAQARRDRKQRQHLMERSFARGTRYGIKQARWRRLWRVEIQVIFDCRGPEHGGVSSLSQRAITRCGQCIEPSGGYSRRPSGKRQRSNWRKRNCFAYPAHCWTKLRRTLTEKRSLSVDLEKSLWATAS